MIDGIDLETGEILRHSQFEQQLAEAITPAETRKVILEIDMLLKIAKSVGEDTERVNELQVGRINAIRQAGGMLAELERNKGGRPENNTRNAFGSLSPYKQGYEDASLSERMAQFWQKVSVIPEDVWESYQDECLTAGSEMSLTGLLIFARKPHVAHNSGENEWYTPAKFIEAARQTMGGIDLDPASNPTANQIVKADHFYTKDDDGLKQDWTGRVWLNPPYSQPEIDDFSKKVVYEYRNGSVEQLCILVNNATETAWFQGLLNIASAVCLIRGRVKFLNQALDPEGAPLQGQVVLYVGHERDEFLSAFQEFGTVLYAE